LSLAGRVNGAARDGSWLHRRSGERDGAPVDRSGGAGDRVGARGPAEQRAFGGTRAAARVGARGRIGGCRAPRSSILWRLALALMVASVELRAIDDKKASGDCEAETAIIRLLPTCHSTPAVVKLIQPRPRRQA